MEAISHMLLKNDSKTVKESFAFLLISFLKQRQCTAFWVFCIAEFWVLESLKGEIYTLCTSVSLPAYLRAWPLIGAQETSIGKNEGMNVSHSTGSPSTPFHSLQFQESTSHLRATWCASPFCLPANSSSFKIQLVILWGSSFKTELDGTAPFSLVLLCNLIQNSTMMHSSSACNHFSVSLSSRLQTLEALLATWCQADMLYCGCRIWGGSSISLHEIELLFLLLFVCLYITKKNCYVYTVTEQWKAWLMTL